MEAHTEVCDVNWWNCVKLKLHRVKCAMMKHPDLCGLLVFTVIWLIGKYSKSSANKQILITQPPPEMFFPASSPVHDSFTGSLAYLNNQVREEEVVFVMFYAPWSVRSIEARHQFDGAAQIMGQQVNFLAVNCWWSSGQCCKKYKFYSYPVFYMYHANMARVRYTGAITVEHIVQFLHRVLYPYTPLYNRTQILEFMSVSDPCILGHFDFHASPQPPGLKQFYFASLRALQKGGAQPLPFGVIVGRHLAAGYNMTQSPAVTYIHHHYRINQSFSLLNFTSTNIHSWVSDLTMYRPMVSWLQLPRRKSRYLRDIFDDGPSLLVFLPDNPLYHNILYSNMQSFMYDYHDCDSSAPLNVSDRSNLVRQYVHRTLQQQHVDCTSTSTSTSTSSTTANDKPRLYCCSSLMLSPTYQRCNVCQSATNNVCDLSKILQDIHEKNENNELSRTLIKCSERHYDYYSQRWTSLCCETSHQPLIHHRVKDSIVTRLRNVRVKVECEKLAYSRDEGLVSQRTMLALSKRFYAGFDRDDGSGIGEGVREEFAGVGCRSNRSVSVTLLDARLHDSVRRHLHLGRRRVGGVDVVLVDAKREEHYVLRQPFTRRSLGQFIVNFTQGLLPRARRSWPPGGDLQHCSQDGDCITEISAQTFHQNVLDTHKDVLVLHYSSWCGPCVALTEITFRLARHLKYASRLRIVRINGDKNELTWPHTAYQYPTLQLYPAHRKSESVTFPEHVPRTVSNLVRFILNHSSMELRLQISVSNVCTQPCLVRHTHMLNDFTSHMTTHKHSLLHRLDDVTSSHAQKYTSFNGGAERHARVSEEAERRDDKYWMDLKRRVASVEKRLKRARTLEEVLAGSGDPDLLFNDGR